MPCSSPDHAPDLLARLAGQRRRGGCCCSATSTRSIAHAAHRPLAREGEKLVGSGAVDMKGGVVLSLGVLRALAARPEDFAEVALLLVCDEEWRTPPFAPRRALRGLGRVPVLRGRRAHARRRTRASSCAARRPGTMRVDAHGRAAHSGSAPDRGRNALLALAAAAQAVAGATTPTAPTT